MNKKAVTALLKLRACVRNCTAAFNKGNMGELASRYNELEGVIEAHKDYVPHDEATNKLVQAELAEMQKLLTKMMACYMNVANAIDAMAAKALEDLKA